ncbi:hypothetical protein C2G38_2141915 [Gigaspora rosea]|uniref:Uncharacterized protein n=1 Tax=Gigaspora rosea TaxID=44941 RepID=A0A397VB03_9GLOM|nr:hypothetical protein C2G38_2141915 [Gigaspora rosea]
MALNKLKSKIPPKKNTSTRKAKLKSFDNDDCMNRLFFIKENIWRMQYYTAIANCLDQLNKETYVVEVLAPILTTFAKIPILVTYKTNWGKIKSPLSKVRKKGHGNKLVFILHIAISDKDLELVSIETG